MYVKLDSKAYLPVKGVKPAPCWVCGRLGWEHHILHRSTHPHLKEDKSNLIPLCDDCHIWNANASPHHSNPEKVLEWYDRWIPVFQRRYPEAPQIKTLKDAYQFAKEMHNERKT